MWSPRVGAISLSLVVLNVCWGIRIVGSSNDKSHSSQVGHSQEGGQGELSMGTQQDDTMAELWEYIGQHTTADGGPRPLRQTWRRRTLHVVRKWSRRNARTSPHVPMFRLHSLGNSTSQSFNTRVAHTSSSKRPSSTFSSRLSSTFTSRPSSTLSSRLSSTFTSRPSSTFPTSSSSISSSVPAAVASSKARRLVTVEPGYMLVMTKASARKGDADADNLMFVPETEQVRVDSRETVLKKGADGDEEQSASEGPLVLHLFSNTTEKGKTPMWSLRDTEHTKAAKSHVNVSSDVWISKSNYSNFDNVSMFLAYITDKVNDEAGITPAVARGTPTARTTSPFQRGRERGGGKAAVNVSETVINRISERPATPSGTEDSISSAVFITDLPGTTESSASVPPTHNGTLPFDSHRPDQRQDFTTSPHNNHTSSQRRDYVTSPHNNHTASQRRDYVTSPHNNHIASQRRGYVTSPHNNHIASQRRGYVTSPHNNHTASQRRDYVTSPHNNHTASQRRDYVTISVDNQSLAQKQAGAEAYVTSLPRQQDVTVHRHRRQVDSTDTTTFSGTG